MAKRRAQTAVAKKRKRDIARKRYVATLGPGETFTVDTDKEDVIITGRRALIRNKKQLKEQLDELLSALKEAAEHRPGGNTRAPDLFFGLDVGNAANLDRLNETIKALQDLRAGLSSRKPLGKTAPLVKKARKFLAWWGKKAAEETASEVGNGAVQLLKIAIKSLMSWLV